MFAQINRPGSRSGRSTGIHSMEGCIKFVFFAAIGVIGFVALALLSGQEKSTRPADPQLCAQARASADRVRYEETFCDPEKSHEFMKKMRQNLN